MLVDVFAIVFGLVFVHTLLAVVVVVIVVVVVVVFVLIAFPIVFLHLLPRLVVVVLIVFPVVSSSSSVCSSRSLTALSSPSAFVVLAVLVFLALRLSRRRPCPRRGRRARRVRRFRCLCPPRLVHVRCRLLSHISRLPWYFRWFPRLPLPRPPRPHRLL